MSVIRLSGWLGALVLLFGLGSTANAQWGMGGFGGLGGYGFGYGFGGVYSLNPPPYFAMFPPVYYSYPVARPYGFGPFAYPPGVMTPSETVVATGGNRRYRSSSSPRQTASVSRPKPVIIENPFVLPPEERPTRLSDGRPLPQVIDLRDFAAKPPAPRDALARAADRN